ncbi:MAG: helix-turn-helix domain-containing protein [Candidatus Thermoplasmatota archaeon]|nr:helix-turn-helix domain-containing protein [Candidatus Thermoplasmatota archaeon]
MRDISGNEKLALLGLVTFPDKKDREIADRLSLPNSTFASAKARLLASGAVTEYNVPIFPKIGMELLAAVYSDFNPSVSIDERIKNTKRTVEVYPEMVLSIGESHRGFSLSIAQNITRIMRISHERMRMLADLNLLEIELPIEVLFPFEISQIHRYFNLAPLIYNKLKVNDPGLFSDIEIEDRELYQKDSIFPGPKNIGPIVPNDVDLTKKQKEILYYLVKYPSISASKLALLIDHSRHTISRVKDLLIKEGYMASLKMPDLSRLDYSILSLFHARIDPKNPLVEGSVKNRDLLQEDTIFLVSRPTEMMMLAAYENYVQYNQGMSSFNQFLKSNDHLKMIPSIRNHSLSETRWIKRFEYHPLVKNTFDLKGMK